MWREWPGRPTDCVLAVRTSPVSDEPAYTWTCVELMNYEANQDTADRLSHQTHGGSHIPAFSTPVPARFERIPYMVNCAYLQQLPSLCVYR